MEFPKKWITGSLPDWTSKLIDSEQEKVSRDSNELWDSTRTRVAAVALERGMDPASLKRQVRDVTARLYETSWEAFVQSLAPEPWWQAWLRSSAYRGSGRWLAGINHNMQGSLQFIDDDRFRTALRLRVLIEPATVPDGVCPLCSATGANPLHLLDCMSSQWFWTTRHNEVCDLLGKFIRASTGKDPQYEFEPRAGVRADILYKPEGDGNPIMIDVTIANPAANSYQHLLPHLQEDAVARRREEEKAQAYQEFSSNYGILPFVIEATGRFGPSALKWLQEFPAPPKIKSKLRDQIRSKIWQFNTSQILTLEKNLKNCSLNPTINSIIDNPEI